MESLRDRLLNVLSLNESMSVEDDTEKRQQHSTELRKAVREIADKLKIQLNNVKEEQDS